MRNITLILTAVALSFVIEARAQDAVGTALNKCAAISEDADRLACYDALAAILVPSEGQPSADVMAPAVATTTAAMAPAAPGAAPITDAVGKERVDPPSPTEQPRYTATVSKCEESKSSGQTYFFFENGQVWKQSKYRKLNFRNCAFDVEIAKVTFGYEMYIPSKDREIRVTRVR
ncbi:MAG: hypothetical protein ACE5F8_08970 [Woeseiaceae bacterium]